MAEESRVGTLTGFFYEIYDRIVDPIPESSKFMQAIPFKGGALEIGNKLHINVVVSDEGGFTYAGRDSGAFTVNIGKAFETQDAQVDAYQLLLQGTVDYESAARASSSRKAFLELVGKKLQVMVSSTKRRYESTLLYGQHTLGIGVLSGVAGQVLTIEPQHWAPQMWIGKTGQALDIWGPALADTAVAVALVITAVNLSTREITVSGAVGAAAGGDVLTWNGEWLAAGGAAPTVGVTTRAGGLAVNAAGAFRIAENTGAMFNIDGATYDVWQGNPADHSNAAFVFDDLIGYMGVLANRGLDGNVVAWVSPHLWSKILTDQAGLRRYNGEIVTNAKTGAKAITFYYQTGSIEIKGHGMIKQGYCLITENSKWKRVGAQDFSFKTPGLEEGRDIFWHDPTRAGFSYRYYGAQALFCEMPSHQMLISNIAV